MSAANNTQHCNNPQSVDATAIKQMEAQPGQVEPCKKIKTSQISIQVNMDQEFCNQNPNKQRQKQKKKQYKKRKRQRQKDQQKQSKDQLANIISKIYEGQLTFDKAKFQIEKHLKFMITGQKFHTFLNQAIRQHVNLRQKIQKQMWEFMQEIIHENPFQKSDEDQDFYLVMVDKIYNEYKNLQSSSYQIEQIINLYMFMKSNKQQTQRYDLDRSTFNYFIESDETIKNLIRICQRRISIQHEKQVLELKEICEMITHDDDEDDYYYDDDDQDDFDENFTERSTSVDEEQYFQEKISKKKKKKCKKTDFSCQFYDVVKRINQMQIVRDQQFQCDATEQWAESMKKKFKDCS